MTKGIPIGDYMDMAFLDENSEMHIDTLFIASIQDLGTKLAVLFWWT